MLTSVIFACRWVFLADVPKNLVWAHAQTDLLEAEAIGAANASKVPCKWDRDAASPPGVATPLLTAAEAAPSNGETTASVEAPEPLGQKLELKFMAPEAGKFELTLIVMSSCWLGCDTITTTSVKIEALTGAEKDGGGVSPRARAQRPFLSTRMKWRKPTERRLLERPR